MTKFSNTVSVNTRGAVNSLAKLETALDSAGRAMGRFKSVADKGLGGDSFNKAIGGVEKFGKAGAAASKRIGDSSKSAVKNVQAIGLSYKDVGRIIESQIIFAALNKLTTGFFEAADAAAEFQEQLARIAAIDESDLGFDGLRSEIEQLAIDLGRPLEEVGGAAFEALQNDLGTTEETFALLRKEAQELALVTGGDLTQAVNALSSVYKTFGADAEAVNGISGQFFGTINAGRITLGDLESSLGTLSPLATQIGVDFKELTNSLATITLTGTKANVATTQLRNVFNKLIKPTKALQKVYQDLGVQGFEELTNKIGANGEANGFVGALQALQKAVDGDEQELAKLFNTIRANVGVLNVLTNDTKLYNETADRSARSAKDLATAIEGIEGTAAREAAKNAAELEVIFTRLGDSALEVKNAVVNSFLFITQGSEDAVVALGGFSIAMGGATLAVTKFGVAAGVAFPPVIAFLAVAGAGLGALKGLEVLADEMTSLAAASKKLEADRLEAFVKTLGEMRADNLKEVTDALNNVNSVLNTVADSAIKSGNEIVAAFQIDSGNIQATEAALLEAFGDARTRVLKQIEDAISEIDSKILAGEKRIRGLTQDLEDVQFEFKIENLDAAQQATERIKRATESIAKSQKAIADVGLGEQAEDLARASAKEAVSQARAAKSAADRSKNQIQRLQAQRTLESAIKNEIGLETRLNNLRGDLNKKNLVDQQQAFEKLSSVAKEQLDDVVEARKAIADAAAKGATPEETNKLKDALIKETNEARKALLDAAQSRALETFDLKDQFEDAIKEVTSGLDDTQIDWTKALDGLAKDLAARTDLKATAEITAKIVGLSEGNETLNKAVQDAVGEGGLPGDVTKNAAQAVLDVYKEQQALQATTEESASKTEAAAARARQKFFDARNELNSGSLEASKLADPVLAQLDKLGDLNKAELEQLIKNLEAAIPAIAEQTTGLFGTFTEEQKANLTAGVKAAIEAATASAEGLEARKLFDPANLEAARVLLDRISSEDIQDLGFEVDSEGFKEVNTALDEINKQAGNAKKEVTKIGTEGALAAVRGLRGVHEVTNGLKSAAANAQSAYQRLLDIAKQALQTAQEAASVNASNSSNGLFFGGRPMYRNDGGATRGQDTLPAMLDPEEFVVNSKASRNFFPELNALNAGNSPSAGSGSNGDTNITIGDINVSSTSDVPGQTARDISLALKRELRRGTS